jgi:hypothetical protein
MTSVPPPEEQPVLYQAPEPFSAQPYPGQPYPGQPYPGQQVSIGGVAYIPAPPVRSKRLGIIALVVAVVVLLLAVAISVIVGVGAVPYTQHAGGGFSFNLNANSSDPTEAALAALGLAQGIGGTLLGLGAIIMGIIAIATRRGRGFGIAALVVAVLAPILTVVTELATVGIASAG